MAKEGLYGRLGLGEGEIPLRDGILRFPSSPKEKPHLIASKCKSCGDISFPPKIFCGKCEGQDVEMISLSNRGKIYSYTVVRQMAIPGIEVPYVLAIVKLPDDPELLIATQIADCEPEDVSIGMEVEMIIDKVRTGLTSGKDVIGYKFRPVKKQG